MDALILRRPIAHVECNGDEKLDWEKCEAARYRDRTKERSNELDLGSWIGSVSLLNSLACLALYFRYEYLSPGTKIR